jgi:hypothetical protein
MSNALAICCCVCFRSPLQRSAGRALHSILCGIIASQGRFLTIGCRGARGAGGDSRIRVRRLSANACEIRLRAERKAGELLAKTEKGKGARENPWRSGSAHLEAQIEDLKQQLAQALDENEVLRAQLASFRRSPLQALSSRARTQQGTNDASPSRLLNSGQEQQQRPFRRRRAAGDGPRSQRALVIARLE